MQYNKDEELTWEELFDQIAYDYESQYGFTKDGRGNYSLNKLYITPKECSYKTENWKISKDAYNKFLKLIELFDGGEDD